MFSICLPLEAVEFCLTGAADTDSEDQMQAWKCMEDSIAISMLLKACHSLHSLESLVIHFTPVGACHQTVRNQAPRKDPFQDISRMYGPVWFDLQGLLKKSLSLRWAYWCTNICTQHGCIQVTPAHPADKHRGVCNQAFTAHSNAAKAAGIPVAVML